MGFTTSVAYSFPATIVNTRVVLVDDAKPFGGVAAAEITMEAPLVPLKLIEKAGFGGEDGHMFLRAEADASDESGMYGGFDTIDRRFSRSSGVVRNMDLFALPVACTRRENCEAGSCQAGSTLRLLLVAPADNGLESMKRVGYTVTDPGRLKYAVPGLRKSLRSSSEPSQDYREDGG
ncbi:Heterokaryon incompatibility [Cordyceps fumosorosea ARSEF 2679]|uniref:Heterokaryon incompatibility n=1 Tax=Cordyceps fumosorosea (strain ARSEF 2679) TaxID=1081104 RepID=A0A167PKQ2_CORFA|nr:Heterokaryon incompatibility [Cordyceps fumosorosea ARSEF 2679]OAA56759.1 Heterokaryon incompatibility [Cordyceps fumosorosea ARSEF 2679]